MKKPVDYGAMPLTETQKQSRLLQGAVLPLAEKLTKQGEAQEAKLLEVMQKIDDFTKAVADLEQTNQETIIEALTANASGISKGMPITNINEVTTLLKRLIEKEYTVQYDAPKQEINIGAGDPKNPIAVRLSDGTKFYDMLKQVVSAQRMPYTDPTTGRQTPITLTADGTLPTSRGLVPFKFDQIVPTWDANNNPTTVV